MFNVDGISHALDASHFARRRSTNLPHDFCRKDFVWVET